MPRRRNTGTGSVYQPTYKAADGKRKKAPMWWIAWTEGGERRFESSGTTSKTEAQTLLRSKLSARDAGAREAKGLPLTVRELVDLVLADYKANQRRSLDRATRSAGHLARVLKEKTLASAVDEATITAYVVTRQEEGAAVATVNRELAHLRRAFHLAARSHRIQRRPDFSTLTERNARQGFLEEGQLQAVLRQLDHRPELQLVVQVAYHTGWRVTSEVLTRQRRHLDLKAGWLRLEPGETKNGDGRMFPLFHELRDLLQAQVALTEALEREQGRVIPWLFHRRGKRIKGFLNAWRAACTRAGLPGKLLHDLRRTAVRNMERRGVPRSAAMKMVGHLTESIYRRYAIVDEVMLKEAGEKLSRKAGRG